MACLIQYVKVLSVCFHMHSHAHTHTHTRAHTRTRTVPPPGSLGLISTFSHLASDDEMLQGYLSLWRFKTLRALQYVRV